MQRSIEEKQRKVDRIKKEQEEREMKECSFSPSIVRHGVLSPGRSREKIKQSKHQNRNKLIRKSSLASMTTESFQEEEFLQISQNHVQKSQTSLNTHVTKPKAAFNDCIEISSPSSTSTCESLTTSTLTKSQSQTHIDISGPHYSKSFAILCC